MFVCSHGLNFRRAALAGDASILFSLWDAPMLGNEIGTPVLLLSVPINEGLFSVSLDFEADAFDNAGRWLQISVNGTSFSSRQPIIRAPYSIQTRGIFVGSDRRVGISNTAPTAKQANTGLIVADVTGQGRAASFYGSTSANLLSVQNDGTGKAAAFTNGDVAFTGGNVGIGTSNPTSALHVEGDYYGLGHMWLHAFEGDGEHGTAYIQARDNSSSSTIGLMFRTQNLGNYTDAVRIFGTPIEIADQDPTSGFSPRVYIAHADSSTPAPVIRLNRTQLDGTFFDFQTSGTSRGSVTVSGNTVSYNAFTSSHYTYPDGPRSITFSSSGQHGVVHECDPARNLVLWRS